MGLFEFFLRKKKADRIDPPTIKSTRQTNIENKTQQEDAEILLEKIEVVPGLVLPRAFANYWPELSQSGTPFIQIKATPAAELAPGQSKFGSFPILPLNFSYPKNQQGEYLYPLAQINFRELPPMPGYPRTGYLQFYISADDTFGYRFDNHPNDFKILFFEESEVENFQTDFSFLQATMESESVPVSEPHALQFELKEEYFGLGNVSNQMNPGISLEQIAAQYEGELEEELMTYAYDHFTPSGHKLGGYAYFTQTDPREYRGEKDKEFVLLLQIDSDEKIMWGDAGVANFFIHPNDLANKDFSKTFYTWDCG
ncbi:YwqG family protein [Pseudoflavitalea rhizosphaerae]|uniref:YwqG family protein n=1 Tax=Pseudoflavitalea rhizosphaerae TaxID=1884793 RepID=UPI000F8D1C17|nr:YwqG family protein [Pseudoflavitalea rhizosphaerae]